MDMKAQKGYSQRGSNSINSLIVTPSGKFIDEQGNTITVANLDQYLTSKKELFEMVATGKLGSSTDPRFITRSLGYSNQDEKAKDKDTDLVVNFDHLLIEGIPANLSPSDLDKYQKVIVEAVSNVDIFFTADNRPYLLTGERQVISRVDKMDNGAQASHIHLVINRHSIAKREDLVNDLQFCTDPEKAKALQKALDFSVGKENVLMQSANFSTDNYVAKFTLEAINDALVKNGLSPLTHYVMADGKGTSNAKVSQQSKLLTKQIQQASYTPEVVEEVIAQATEEKYTSLDSVIIQKRQKSNNDRVAELSEELRRLTSENRTLEEAQNAINENNLLRQEVGNKNAIIEDLNKKVEVKDNAIAEWRDRFTEVQGSISEIKNSLDIPLEQDLKDGIKDIIVKKDYDYNALNSELEQAQKEINAERQNVVLKDQEIQVLKGSVVNLNEEVNNLKTENTVLNTDLEKEKALNATLNKSVESMQKVNESVSKHNESLAIQIAEGHKKNSELLSKNNALQAEIDKLKADSQKQMEAFKKQQEEADKKLAEEKVKTAKLEKENAEKDLKFREFATNFVNEVKGKLNSLSASISKLARGIKDPIQKKEANDISKDIKGSLSDFTKKFATVDKKDDNTPGTNTNDPKKKF